jgi:hypothetical protein
MTSSEDRGKKLLQDLAKTVQDKLAPSGEPIANRRGLKMIEKLARELTGPNAMPGLKLYRDTPGKFRLGRPPKNAEISVEWQRDIGAIVMTGEKHAGARKTVRYVYDEGTDVWRRLEEVGDLWEDVVEALVEYLYPEGRTT